jgi:hypothetical protein
VALPERSVIWCYRQLFLSETTSGFRRLAHFNESRVFRQVDVTATPRSNVELRSQFKRGLGSAPNLGFNVHY